MHQNVILWDEWGVCSKPLIIGMSNNNIKTCLSSNKTFLKSKFKGNCKQKGILNLTRFITLGIQMFSTKKISVDSHI